MVAKVRLRLRLQGLFALVPVALAIAAGAQTPGPAPRLDAWTVIGPGGGGTMIAPTISPHDPRVVVEHCDMTGAYITEDGGQSWRMFNLRNGMETFAFDPGNPRRIYAGGAALWRSDDAGRRWRMLFPNPVKKTVEHQNGDHGDYSLTSNDGNYVTGLNIRQIVVDSRDSNVVHIAFSDPQSGGTTVLISKDSGASFRFEHEFLSDKTLLLAYLGGERLAIGRLGVYHGRAETAKPLAGPGETIAHASAGEAKGRTIVYATTSKGNVFVSEDEGQSWIARTPALGQQSGQFEVVAAAGKDGRVAYIGFRGLKLGEGPENTYNGIAKTADAGVSWSVVFRESTHAASNLDASWIEERAAGIGWEGGKSIIFDAPYSLGVAAGNPDICYATDLFRTYRTLDGGKTWAQVNSARVGGNRWTTRGLDVTTAYGVQFDPFDAKHLFIDYTDVGAFHSLDGGESWQTATNGIPDAWRNTTYWLAFDPEVKGLMWGAFSGIHDLPRPKMWHNGGFRERAKGGVGVSTDGGESWTPSNGGMEETAITHVLLDPASPIGRRTLYACGFGIGVYKSTDNGKSWQLKNEGIKELDPFAWRIVRSDDGALYLILSRRNEGRLGEREGGGALYKSVDGAEHWLKLRLPEGVNGPSGLALDPRDNRRIYLSAWGQEREGVDSGGGVFLSTDGAQSWKPVFSQSQHVYDVTIDPRAPETLYICGFDGAAYRSTDAGLHWARIQGYNFKWGHRVIADPVNAALIYIATYGGSVWHGPAGGDPGATEDILTPVPIAQ
jgi:photosystem II stability/assembly factor-like uncharacterized protein